jgi:dTDP-4-amino-4,6-dideoxygalactose transaminase
VGDATAFSLSDGRVVAAGEGGVVAARDEAVAARARLLRSHAMTSGTWDRHRGHAASYDIVDIGFNARLDEARAALATSRLERLGAEVARRRETVARYRAELEGAAGVTLAFDPETAARSAPDALPVAVGDAASLGAALADDGIESARFAAVAEAPPRAAEAARRLLGLPVAGVDSDVAAEVASRVLRAAAAR